MSQSLSRWRALSWEQQNTNKTDPKGFFILTMFKVASSHSKFGHFWREVGWWAGDEREVSSSWSSRTSPLHHTPPPSSNAQPLKTWPWSLQINMLKKILPKVQQTQMAAGENWKKWSNFKRLEDPLNLVKIKNPFGSFECDPQAYAWWVPPFF